MTNENSFDRQIKDSLYNYKSSVPSNLWEKIEADKRMRKTIPFWKRGYFLSAILSLIAITFIAGYFKETSEKNASSTETTKGIDVSSSNESNKSVPIDHSKIVISNKLIDENKAVTNNNMTTQTAQLENSKKDKVDIISNENKSAVSIQSNTTISKSLVENSNIKNSQISKTNNRSEIKKVDVLTNRTIGNSHNSSIVPNNQPILDSKSNSYVLNAKRNASDIVAIGKDLPTKNSESLKGSDTKQSNEVISAERPSTEDLENYHLEKGQIVPYTSKIQTEFKPVTLKQQGNKITAIHVPDISNNNWFINFFASPDFNTQNIQSNSGLSTFSKFQDSTQRISDGFTAGAMLSRNLGNHIQLKSGLQFKQVNERFFYIQNTSKTINVVTNRSYLNNQGATVTVLDTTTYQQSGYTIKTVFNSYKSIELPIIVGWEGKIDKLRFAFNTGLITTLYTFLEGKTNDTSYNIVPLGATHTNGFYRSVPSFSIYGSGSLFYPINGFMDAFAEPYYRFGCSNNIISTVGYNKRYNTAGINFGIRYRFKPSGSK